ncbi:tRNA (N6-isopentenyl adenosine(37)-C2)-methylthiotransferase MiaB [Proteiniclasticum sediminis]|nr:tRNA (N6-isopentenyl adenosine(37)-C2)-methylthiotransferase MiaB [Proteiniclasticum sediminis]
MNKKYRIETWGCQMNEEDSEKLAGMLKVMGYEETLFRDKADIIIFNTCAVRESSENKVHGNLGNLKILKKNNPDLLIAVCGCMMQQKGVPEEILKRNRHVDLIFGTHNAHKFPEYLERCRTENTQILEVYEEETEIVEGIPILRDSRVTAFVTIMYGCDNFCTYCVIPHVRGRERSRKPEDIVQEIRKLVADGYKEVTLLGQNVNAYGKTLEEKCSFADLLRQVNAVEGLERIRFLTSHPKDMSSELIAAIKECSKVAQLVHLPIQSGSDAVLKRMNRKYDREHYRNIVEEIRREVPGVAITTDLIVGFPGETEEDFKGTLEMVEEIGFDSIYTFIYSRRKFTPADRMTEQVPEEVKHERFQRLVDVVNRKSLEINQAYLHQVVEVLVEDFSKNTQEYLQGKTRTGKTVNFKGEAEMIGTLQWVRITKVGTFSLTGELMDKEVS